MRIIDKFGMRHWSPLRAWRRMVAYREWQNQLALHESGRDCLDLVKQAEQRYKEL